MAIGLQQPSPLIAVLAHIGVDKNLVKIIDEVNRLLTTLLMFQRRLNQLSREGLEGILRSFIIDLLTAGLADIGIPLDELLSIQGDILKGIAGVVVRLADITLEQPPVGGQPVDQTKLQGQLSEYLRFLREGKAAANGMSLKRNPTRAGDPVVLHRGEFERRLTDLQVGGAGIDFVFQRIYRSGAVYFGPLGPNWDHSFNLRLLEENEFVVARLTEQISMQRFVKHPRFGEAEFSYYAPPDGVHDVIITDGADSFLMKRPQGSTYYYEFTGQPREHRIRRIEDRFGNRLDFRYSPEDRLQRVYVNSMHRHVSFSYDEAGRLARLEDHTGRIVRYTYDDRGYLDCVAGPARVGERPARMESYEYDPVGRIYKLARVLDWKGRVIVENEYEQNPLADFFGYVGRQTENRGESTFFYETITEEDDPLIPPRDIPRLRVWHTERNGHQVEHLLNQFGNELLVREHLVEGCRIRERISRFRYNADGQVIARLDPEGVLTQYLFGRDHIAEAIEWPDADPVLGDVPLKDRMGFGNLLATVTRARPVAQTSSFRQSFWEQMVPSVKMPDRLDDVVTKFLYDRDSQLLLSRSDPRWTISADPLHTESATPATPHYDPADPRYIAHQRHLTRYVYGPPPRLELRETRFPDRTRPSPLDGVAALNGIVEEVRRYDANGRPLEYLDARGYEWFNEYYPALNAREGFLQRQIIPHAELILNKDTPDILEIQRHGAWQPADRYLLSGGAVGDHLDISLEGVRFTLYQSIDPDEKVSNHAQVEVHVDGQPGPAWDQTADAFYIIKDLARGLHVIDIRDPLGTPISVGRVRTHVSLEYRVDELGRVLGETNGRGHVRVHEVDVLGNKKKVIEGPAANPSVTHYEYDPDSRLLLERTEWRDEAGQERPEVAIARRYHYDKAGLLLSALAGAERGEARRITRYRYDAEDNLSETINPRRSRTYFEYDALNRQVRTTWGACTAERVITTTTYDLADRALAQRNPRGARYFNGYLDAGGTWQAGIDAQGRVHVRTDPLGHLTVTDYDKLNHPTVVRQFERRPDGQFEMLSRMATEYDEHGDPVRVTDAIFEDPILTADPTDPNQVDQEFTAAVNAGHVRTATTEFHLDAKGNTIATRNADGGIHRKRFDGQGRVYDQVDAEGRRTYHIYDGNGNIIRHYLFEPVRDPATDDVTHYEAFLQLHEYDELNRETARIGSYGNRWRRQYDTVGNMTRMVDPLANVVLSKHNAFGEEVVHTQERTQTGLGGGPPLPALVTRYEYDAGGNMVTLIDPANRRTEFSYDLLNRPIASHFAVGLNEPRELQSYDRAGNLVSITDRNGLVRKMTYDLLDRHIRTDIEAAGVIPEHKLSPASATFAVFQYDAAGRLTRHENDYCVISIHSDSRGLTITEEVTIRNIAGAPRRLTILREFDLAGRRRKLIYPSGRELLYTYDHSGQLTSVQNLASPPDYPGQAANAVQFDLVRNVYTGYRPVSIVMGNNLVQKMLFDGCGQMLERSVIRPDGMVMWRLQRLRDAAGFTRVESATTRHGSRSRKLALDSTHRLTHYEDSAVNWVDPLQLSPPHAPVDPPATNGQALMDGGIGQLAIPGVPHVFEYDEMGNRLETREPGLGPFGSQPNALNQYAAVDGVAWQYDPNGNLRSDDTRAFAYDLNDTLEEISDIATDTNQATYYRDALGRVVAEKTPHGTAFRVSDGLLPLVEITAAGRTEYTPDHLAETIIHAAQGGEDYWITRDGLGSVRLLTDSQGNIVSIPTYRPYGSAEDAELNLSPLRFGFGSMWFTPNLMFLHSATRSYRHDVGRYLQRDPAGQVDNANPYVYVNNSPIDRWDPKGLEGEQEGEFIPSPYSLGDFQLKLDLSFLDKPPDPVEVWVTPGIHDSPYFEGMRLAFREADKLPWYETRAKGWWIMAGMTAQLGGYLGYGSDRLLAAFSPLFDWIPIEAEIASMELAIQFPGGLDDLGVGVSRQGLSALRASRLRIANALAPRAVTLLPGPLTVDIFYNTTLAASPGDANFLRAAIEWAQSGPNLLRVSTRNALDASWRARARRWMDRAGVDRTGLNAMHPVDSIINPHHIPETGAYYFGNASVNQSFGSQVGNALRGVPVGTPVQVRFHRFPSYQLVPPLAPPVSFW